MAVADASFRTVKLSMSSGLMEESGSDMPAMPSFETGRPSMTMSGLWSALRDAVPRMRMVAPAPGIPEPAVTTTPALLPRSRSAGVVMTPLLSSSALTVETEPVRSLFLTVP